jgi:hypothetical protein
VKDFNPDEARDDKGKWTAGGGDAGGGDAAAAAKDLKLDPSQSITDLSAEFLIHRRGVVIRPHQISTRLEFLQEAFVIKAPVSHI